MTEIRLRPKDEGEDRIDPDTDRVVALPSAPPKRRRRYGGALLGAGALLLLLGGLGLGGWRHYQAAREVAAVAQDHQTFVPDVRVAAVRDADGKISVTLPATTTAFEAANIFARTSGYIEKRYVDIGDQVKAGDPAGGYHGAGTRPPDHPGAGDAGAGPGHLAADAGKP